MSRGASAPLSYLGDTVKFSINATKVAKDLAQEARNIEFDANAMVKGAVANIMEELQDMPPGGTPRDTRRAVNGWNASPGRTPDYTDPGEAASHAEPNPKAEVAKIPDNTKEANIANGVPYIGKLEFGSSKQAPVNFVRQAIARAVSYLDYEKIARGGLSGDVDRGTSYRKR